MTVAQLIQLLQQFPDDMAVLVEGYETTTTRSTRYPSKNWSGFKMPLIMMVSSTPRTIL